MLSAVAGIVDAKGGFRVVVTQLDAMHCHVGPGEQLFVVPDMMFQEPVPRESYGWMMEAVWRHVQAQIGPLHR
jgi:hypothetical protein